MHVVIEKPKVLHSFSLVHQQRLWPSTRIRSHSPLNNLLGTRRDNLLDNVYVRNGRSFVVNGHHSTGIATVQLYVTVPHHLLLNDLLGE